MSSSQAAANRQLSGYTTSYLPATGAETYDSLSSSPRGPADSTSGRVKNTAQSVNFAFVLKALAATLMAQRANADCGYAYITTALTPRVNCTATAVCQPGQMSRETACGVATCFPPCNTTENASIPLTTAAIPECGEAEETCAFEGEGIVTFHGLCSSPDVLEIPTCGNMIDCAVHICTSAPTEHPTDAPSFAPTSAPSRAPGQAKTAVPTHASAQPTGQSTANGSGTGDNSSSGNGTAIGIGLGLTSLLLGSAALGCAKKKYDANAQAQDLVAQVARQQVQHDEDVQRLRQQQAIALANAQRPPAQQPQPQGQAIELVFLPQGAAAPAQGFALAAVEPDAPAYEEAVVRPPSYSIAVNVRS